MFQSSPVREGRALEFLAVGRLPPLFVSILARPRRTGALHGRSPPAALRWFQSSPVREGRALGGIDGREPGQAGFNPRPSAKDGRSTADYELVGRFAVSILARPRRTGARMGAQIEAITTGFQSSPVREGRALALIRVSWLITIVVSILARPRRTGAQRQPSASEAILSFNPRPSAKDGRSKPDKNRFSHVVVSILARPRRTGARQAPHPQAVAPPFQSSPVREGRALDHLRSKGFTDRVSILARPRRTGAHQFTVYMDPAAQVSILARPRRTGARNGIVELLPKGFSFNPRPSAKDGRSSH